MVVRMEINLSNQLSDIRSARLDFRRMIFAMRAKKYQIRKQR
jgi:hypothetical protein